MNSVPSPEEILISLKAELSKIEGAINKLGKSIPSYNSTIRLEELHAMTLNFAQLVVGNIANLA